LSLTREIIVTFSALWGKVVTRAGKMSVSLIKSSEEEVDDLPVFISVGRFEPIILIVAYSGRVGDTFATCFIKSLLVSIEKQKLRIFFYLKLD